MSRSAGKQGGPRCACKMREMREMREMGEMGEMGEDWESAPKQGMEARTAMMGRIHLGRVSVNK